MPSKSVRFKDTRLLAEEPKIPNSVKWAEDGTIAAATGNHINLAHPSFSEGLSGVACLDEFHVDLLQAPLQQPDRPNMHYNMVMPTVSAHMFRKTSYSSRRKTKKKIDESGTSIESSGVAVNPAEPRALEWSPAGMATAGGCLLTCIGEDHHLSLLSFSKSMKVEWDVVFKPSLPLLEYLKASRWEMVDVEGREMQRCMVEGPGFLRDNGEASEPDAVLRLRGGTVGKSSKGFNATGSSDQEMEDDSLWLDTEKGFPEGCRLEADQRQWSEEVSDKAERFLVQSGSRNDGQAAIADLPLGVVSSTRRDPKAENTEGPLGSHRSSGQQDRSNGSEHHNDATRKSNGNNNYGTSEERQNPISDACLNDPDNNNESKKDAAANSSDGDTVKLNADDKEHQCESDLQSKIEPVEPVSWRDLPPVDTRNTTLMRQSLVDGSVRRFFRLRRQLDPSTVPQYESESAHLAGADVSLLDQVTAEYYRVYNKFIKDVLGYSQDKWKVVFRSKLRLIWNVKSDVIRRNFDPFSDGGLIHPENQVEAPMPSRELLAEGAANLSVQEGQSLVDNTSNRQRAGENVSTPSGRGRPKGSYTVARQFGLLPSDSYDHRLLSVSFISIGWSPSVPIPRFSDLSRRCPTASYGSRIRSAHMVAFLAAGTKEGRIWLWKCTAPSLFKHPEDKKIESSSMRSRIKLIGSVHVGYVTHITSLTWTSLPIHTHENHVMLLFCGASDGSVHAFGADTMAMVQAELPDSKGSKSFGAALRGCPDLQGGVPMGRWGCVFPSDEIGVISLSATVRLAAEDAIENDSSAYKENTRNNGLHVVLAIGKSVGAVAAWLSAGLSDPEPDVGVSFDDGLSLQERGQVNTRATDVFISECQRALSAGCIALPVGKTFLEPYAITSVALVASGEVLLACNHEGTLAAWTMPAAPSHKSDVCGMQLHPCAPPVPCSRVDSASALGYQAYGLASSPGQVMVAVMSTSNPPGLFFVKQLQIHQKLHLSFLRLFRLVGSDAIFSDLGGVAHVVAEEWAWGRAPAAALWDAMQLVKYAPRFSRAKGVSSIEVLLKSIVPQWESQILAKIDAARRNDATDEHAPAERHDRDNKLPLDFPKPDIGPNSLSEPSVKFPSSIRDIFWRQLKAAVSLRRASDEIDSEAIDRDEMALFQHHIEGILRGHGNKGQQDCGIDRGDGDGDTRTLSRLLAADWIMANHSKHSPALLFQGMLDLARQVYRNQGEPIPQSYNEIPMRELKVPSTGQTFCFKPMGGGSVWKSLQARIHEIKGQVGSSVRADESGCTVDRAGLDAVVLPRCPATLLPCLSSQQWGCRICKRIYEALPLSQWITPESEGNTIECVLCGGLIGPLYPSFVMRPPCM